MEKSKLVRVLNTLSKIEIREFKKYLASPIHNQRADVQDLLALILAYLLNKSPMPDKASFYKELFPTQPFDLIKFDLLISYLFRLLKKYLAWKEWEQNDFIGELAVVRQLKKRGLKEDAQQILEKLKKDLEKQPFRDATYFNNLQKLQWEQHLLSDTNSPQKEAEKWAMSTNLDQYYFAKKLKQYCLLLSYQQVYPFEYELPFIEQILVEIIDTKQVEIPIIAVYFHCIKMLKQGEDVANFLNFKTKLFEHQALFPTHEFRPLLLAGINYSVRQVNIGEKQFLKELLDLYKTGLKTASLLENGQLSRITYHNIVGTGINNQELDWTAHFISSYKNKLERKYRESTYSFSLARLAYQKKDYDAVLQLLQKSNYRDLLLNLAAKTLLLKVYVEQDQDALLFPHLEAMQRYIRRKHIMGYHKKNYLNIIKYTKKMRSLNFFDKTEIAAFTKTVQTEEVLTEKSWFIEQLSTF